MSDWFDQNAPASPASTGDWFSANAPEPQPMPDLRHNVVRSAGEYAAGVGKGLLGLATGETEKNLLNLATGTVANMAGQGNNPAFAEQTRVANAAGQNLKDRYGSLSKIGHTLSEDPVGSLADASTVLGGAGAVARGLGTMANLPTAVRAGDMLATGAALTNPLELPGAIGRTVLPSSVRERFGARLYQSALKPPVSMGDPVQLSTTGMREGIPLGFVNRSSALNKARGVIDQLHQGAQGIVDAGAAAGATVDPQTVANYTSRSAAKFANQVNPTADLNAIQGAGREFLEAKGGATFDPDNGMMTNVPRQIPVDEAQEIKRGTYQKLRDSYGEISTAAKEAQKDLARGLKEEVYNQFPQLRAMGQREGSVIELENALERYAQRFGNRDIAGIGTPITAGMGGALGGPKGALIAGLAKAAIDNPYVKSRLAIALYKSAHGGRSSIPAVVNPTIRLNNLPPQFTSDQLQ